jgi:HK97 family phage major capsid protein
MNAEVIGLTRAEQRRFSLARLVAATCLRGHDGAKAAKAAGFELEACGAVREKLGLTGPGYPLTDELMLGRTLTATGGVGTGGAIVETEVPLEWWGPALRAQSKVRALGATVAPAKNSLSIPILTTGSGAGADTENASQADADPAFAASAYAPFTITANSTASRRLLVQTELAEIILRRDLVAAVAEKEDLYSIQGSNAGGQPQGLIGFTGVTVSALGTNGGAPTWAMVLDCIRQVGLQKAVQGGAMGWLASTKAAVTMRNVSKTASWGFLWDDPTAGAGALPPTDAAGLPDGFIAGYRAMMSENVPSTLTKGTSGATLSALIFGNWADFFILEYSPPYLLPDPYTFSNTGAVRFNVHREVAVGPRRPKSFCNVVDMIAA